MNGRIAVVIGLLVVIVFGLPPVTAAASAPSNVRVSIRHGEDGARILHGEFTVDAPASVVWQTLTDYDHLPSFVSSVTESHLRPGPIVVQRMSGAIGPFRKEIFLDLALDESPKSRIDFQDFGHRSFSRYVGSWKIYHDTDHVRVVYDLEATPKFFSPSFLTRGAFRGSVLSLLSQVRQEVIRRTRESPAPIESVVQ